MMLNDFMSLRYCQSCEKWVETCEHFQSLVPEGSALIVYSEDPEDELNQLAEPEGGRENRAWWKFW